jgi:hypothetical protein
MDGADAVMFETAAETIRFRLFKNDSNYRSGRKLTLIQVPQNTPQIKQNVLSLKQFVVMQQLWLTLSRQKLFLL